MALNRDRRTAKEKPSINIEPINPETAEGFMYPSPEDSVQIGSKLNEDKVAVSTTIVDMPELSAKEETAESNDSVKKETSVESGKVRTSLYIKKDYFEKMQLAAENEGVPASAIVMAALKDFFELHPELIEEKKKTVNWDNI